MPYRLTGTDLEGRLFIAPVIKWTNKRKECPMKKRTEKKDLEEKNKNAKRLEVEELEERVALSVPTQKKSPFPSPYAPGTDYGLVKRSNL